MNKGWLVAIAVLALLIAIRVAIGLSDHKSDQEQIREALQYSIQLSKDGKPGGLMDLIGNQLTVNSQDASGQTGQIADFIKKQHPEVTFGNMNAVVNGDHAQITTPATVDLAFLSQHRTINLDHVLLLFHKEPATRWGVIPTEKWKLEQVEVPNLPLEQFGG